MLDTKAKVFHENNSCFMKSPKKSISWNALKEKFHGVSYPILPSHNSQGKTCGGVSVLLKLESPKETPAQFFSLEFWKTLKNICGWLLINTAICLQTCQFEKKENSSLKSEINFWRNGELVSMIKITQRKCAAQLK